MGRLAAVLLASLCYARESTPDALIVAGHWKRARTLVERRQRDAPEDPSVSFLLSQIRNAFGDRTSPLGLAEKAVRLAPGVARYHRQLAEVQGVMAQRAGVFHQALLARRFRKEIDAALELDSGDVQAWRDLMEFHLLAPGIIGGDSGKAEKIAQRIGSLDAAEGFLARARIAELRKDPAGQEAMLRRAAAVRPPSYKALVALAEFYLAGGQRDDASVEWLARSAIAIDKGRAAAYGALASLYAGQANWTALEMVLASASEAVPDDLSPDYRAAERLLGDGRDPARAERYLRVYLGQEPEGNEPTAADAHWKLGIALRAQGRDGTEEWRMAARLDPNSPATRELSGK